MYMDIEKFISIIGANSKLRDDCINWPTVFIKLFKGRHIENESDCEALLTNIDTRQHGVSPSVARDRWEEYLASQVSDNTLKSQTIPNTTSPSLAQPYEYPKEITSTIVDLLAIIAEQQRQLRILEERVDSMTFLHVQSHLSNQAQNHFKKSLHDSLEQISQSNLSEAFVKIGSITHKGRLTIDKKSSLEERNTVKESQNNEHSTSVNVNAEITGVMKRLAGANLGVEVDLTKVESRLEAISQSVRRTDSVSLEGEYEISHEGIKIGTKK